MPELTQKEVEKRMLKAAARARESIAKKEVLQFRLESEKILKLYEIAAEQKIDLSKLLRQVVTEFIDRQHAPFPLVDASVSSQSTVSAVPGDPVFNALMVIYERLSQSKKHKLNSRAKKKRKNSLTS